MKNNLKFYYWKEFFKTVKNLEFQLWWGQRWKICKDRSFAMYDTINKSETAKNKITGLKHANRCRRHFWNLGWIERDGTHIRKKFDCSKQNFSGASYMFFAVFRIWAQARHLALAKIQMVQSMPAVCLPKWSSLFGAIFSERVR